MKLIEENKLWAGLVFVDFPEDSDSDELPEVCGFDEWLIRIRSGNVADIWIGFAQTVPEQEGNGSLDSRAKNANLTS